MTSNYSGADRRAQIGEDAPWAGQFVFSIDGMEIGHFMEVSGLSVTVEDEKIPGSLDYYRGVLAMANAGPNTNGSQFFICHGDARFLDRQYTAFGQLVKGDDVLEKLATVPTRSGGGGEKSTPIERVAIESIRIVPAA